MIERATKEAQTVMKRNKRTEPENIDLDEKINISSYIQIYIRKAKYMYHFDDKANLGRSKRDTAFLEYARLIRKLYITFYFFFSFFSAEAMKILNK